MMFTYTITVHDGYRGYTRKLKSKSGYFSIEDIFSIISANTDLRRDVDPKTRCKPIRKRSRRRAGRGGK